MMKSVLTAAMLLAWAVTLPVSCNRPADNNSNTPVHRPSPDGGGVITVRNPDFTTAARLVTPAVVHINTTYESQQRAFNPLEELFGAPGGTPAPARGSGSGVTISEDGYIATNNHVVENASRIVVVYPDRREFVAELAGTDPNTDLALLKVNAKDLPTVRFGNSDRVQVGEWVLAVGYPYSLNTTVTAGIVSAKGRSIGIIGSREGEPRGSSTAIESFIQTDAAINPGNSGGALVNAAGELIGINTAIASLTGSYTGYAFAIPVNLAQKILDDLKKYGSVRRGILGVAFPSPAVESQFFKAQGIDPASVSGVFITDIQEGSAAAEAGLREGDIIQRINGTEIFSSGEFSERIARHRPNDRLEITYLRGGKQQTASVTLKGEESLARNGQSADRALEKLGASFAPLSPALKERLNLRSGVIVTEVYRGGFFEQLGIPRGTIIAYVNGRAVAAPQDLERALLAARNRTVQILGIAPDGSRVAFNFSLGT